MEGELGADGAPTSWRSNNPCLPSLIFADEGPQDVVEPKQDRDLAGPKAGTSGAIIALYTH